eukprot:PhF_6_TR504/c0_g1_i1/m.266
MLRWSRTTLLGLIPSCPNFTMMEVHEDPTKGFYLSVRYLPTSRYVEVLYRPQDYTTKGVFLPDDSPQFDINRGVFKRFFQHSIAEMIAVCEQKKPLMEHRTPDLKERRVAFKRIANGDLKLYMAAHQLRITNSPLIEATITFRAEDAVRLHRFLEYSLRQSFLPDLTDSDGQEINVFRREQGKSNRLKLIEKYAECLYCKKRGHYEANCPDREAVTLCSKCGEVGHFAHRCPTEKRCGYCGQQGHGRRSCPSAVLEGR